MRIYGKKREIADGYFEVAYKEYREDGTLKCTGTEDFSAKRYAMLAREYVWTWDGEKRNKGGHRWFDCEGLYVANSKQDIKAYARIRFPEAKVIQLR